MNVTEQIENFEPISLEAMNQVRLLDRLDKKYMFKNHLLGEILEAASEFYYILEIQKKRFAAYDTTYFDTPDYEMYTRHHNGKLNRYKVRFRTYADSGLNFFEVKFKTNTGRTRKSRLQLQQKSFDLTGNVASLLEKKTYYKAENLTPAIQVCYNRITLVNRNMTERLTIDFDLNYRLGEETASYPDLVIAEVKQDKSGTSPFIEIMQQQHIKNVSISKYCLGIASLVKSVKTNNFKPKIRYVNQLFTKSA